MAEALTTVLPRSFASVGTFRRASRPTSGAVRRRTRAELDDARDASSRASFSIGRRASLAGAGASALAGTFPLPSRADVLTPKGYDDPVVSPTGWNLLESDKDTIGCAYVIEWPSGWCALSDLSSARPSAWTPPGKPLDEASTLAVFISDAAGARSVADRGSLEKVAASRRLGAATGSWASESARPQSATGAEALTYDVETKVGGGTAERFGSAVELVGITVHGGKEYLIRATASASAWPAERARLRRAVESSASSASVSSRPTVRYLADLMRRD